MDVQPHLLNLSAYIDQNLEKDLPLSILAKRVGLSPFHFHRKFGAYFGESLHQHIKRLRLERAAFSLIHGSQPVRQIARDSGYKTVSAFSHAFSGFAGESPTRYRSLASSNGASAADDESGDRHVDRLEAAWVGDLPPSDIAFLRAMGSGNGQQQSVRQTLEAMMKLVGTLVTPAVNGASDPSTTDPRGFECIVATSDVYGVSKGGDFRIDVGLDAARVPDERASNLGRQTLPGGRYARFDIRCGADEIVANALRVSLGGLRRRGETPRLSQYFVRFKVEKDLAADTAIDYRLFVPLIG